LTLSRARSTWCAFSPLSQPFESSLCPSQAAIETGTRVEWMEESNYKFRLSAFREPLLKWLQSSPSPVQPPSRSTALVSALTQPSSTDLNDLSISRPFSRLSWGIRVPDDPEHTIYVWVDALVNYLTAAGYPWKGGEAFEEGKVWPPNLQIVGKDIIRCVLFLYLFPTLADSLVKQLPCPLPSRHPSRPRPSPSQEHPHSRSLDDGQVQDVEESRERGEPVRGDETLGNGCDEDVFDEGWRELGE